MHYPRGTRLVLHKNSHVYVVTEEPSIAAETNLRPGEKANRDSLVVSPTAHTVEVQEIAHVEHLRRIPSHWITRGMNRSSEANANQARATVRRRWRKVHWRRS